MSAASVLLKTCRCGHATIEKHPRETHLFFWVPAVLSLVHQLMQVVTFQRDGLEECLLLQPALQ